MSTATENAQFLDIGHVQYFDFDHWQQNSLFDDIDCPDFIVVSYTSD